METLWVAGPPDSACAESLHPVTPVSASMRAVADLMHLPVWRCLASVFFSVFHNNFNDAAENVLMKSTGDIHARSAYNHPMNL